MVGRGVSTRGTLPILSNVLLRSDGGRLRLTTTNLEVGINHWVPAKVEDDGAITVPAKLLSDFVNSLGPGQIDLSLNVRTKTLHLKSGAYEANIKGIDAEEFPLIPAVPDKPTTSISQAILRRMVREVAFVASTDDSRPILTGCLTSFSGSSVTMAAADPYRLSVRTSPLLKKVDAPLEVIIPAKSLFEVERILTDTDDAVEITILPNGSQVVFHTDDTDLVSRVIEGTYVNYKQVIPGKSTTTVVLQRADLLTATKLAGLFARDAANIVRFQVDPKSDPPLMVSATAAEVGDNTGRVEATVVGDATTIAFNSRFVTEALDRLTEASEVKLELGGPLAPGVIRIVGDEENYLHVVMPLRIPS